MEDGSDVPLLFREPGPAVEGRNWKLFNIIVLGVSFMLLFTAFQTCSMVETIVLESAVKDSNGTFNGKGYTSLAIIYGVFAVSNWLAPSVVAVFGAKLTLIGGALLYCAYIALFLKPLEVTLYLFSALVGLGAAVLWTAQGNLLTINSTAETRGRDTGIFWALMQCSLLIGNLFFFFEFNNAIDIEASKRMVLFAVLTVVAVIGMLFMFLIRNTPVVRQSTNDLSSEEKPPSGGVEALRRSVQMFFTKEMLMLSFCFAYTGFEQSYWAGIYGTSVGHTSSFGSLAKQLTGLSGVFVGIGEICGGAAFGLMGNRRGNGFGRDSVVFFGYVVHIICFFLIFLNSPDESPLQDTFQIPFLFPNEYLAMFCAFLLGLGDSSFNTQIYPILGALYPEDSASACAIYKFIQALASAMAFVYGRYLVQKWHLLILTVFGTFGSIFFFVVDRAAHRRLVMTETEIQQSP
jgi:MFS family permease